MSSHNNDEKSHSTLQVGARRQVRLSALLQVRTADELDVNQRNPLASKGFTDLPWVTYREVDQYIENSNRSVSVSVSVCL
jgi:hypothetical protein